MNRELELLYDELKKVESTKEEYLSEYNYQSKEEVLELIKEDIMELEEEEREEKRMEEEKEDDDYDYAPGELEEERRNLCLSLGISRYC